MLLLKTSQFGIIRYEKKCENSLRYKISKNMNIATLYDLRTNKIRKEKELLEVLLESSDSVFEVGCGTGRIISMLSSRVHNIIGVEANKEFADRAKSRFSQNINVNIIEGDFQEISVSEKFDAVLFMFNIFCEFITPQQRIAVLKKAKEMISNDGIIILANDMPNFSNWCKKEDCYEATLPSIEANVLPWQCKMYVKRNTIEQTSKCQVQYTAPDNKNIIEDSYTSALLTRSELLTLYYCLGFKIEEFGGYDFSRLTDKSTTMIHILRKN